MSYSLEIDCENPCEDDNGGEVTLDRHQAMAPTRHHHGRQAAGPQAWPGPHQAEGP